MAQKWAEAQKSSEKKKRKKGNQNQPKGNGERKRPEAKITQELQVNRALSVLLSGRMRAHVSYDTRHALLGGFSREGPFTERVSLHLELGSGKWGMSIR